MVYSFLLFKNFNIIKKFHSSTGGSSPLALAASSSKRLASSSALFASSSSFNFYSLKNILVIFN